MRYWLFFGLSIKRRVLTVPFVEIQGGVALFVDIQIWHTLAEVKIFVFLFVIKLFLNCCCSINVLYCFANFFFLLRSVLCV